MVPSTAEQPLTLRDQFLRPESDEGGARFRAIAAGLGLVSCAVFGLGVSIGAYARQHSLTKTTTTVAGGHGEVTRVGRLKFPETYYGVVDTTITDITASEDNKILDRFSWSNKATVNLVDGKYSMKVGNGQLDIFYKSVETGDNKLRNKKVIINFPLDKLLATVYETDPTKSGMEDDNGAVMMLQANRENFINALPFGENFINALPFGKSHNINDKYERLKGLVRLDAYKISVKKCAPSAWSYLQPIYFEDLAKYTAEQLSIPTPDNPIKPEDVEIIPEGEPMFTSQYEDQFKKLSDRNESNGDHFIIKDKIESVDCNVNPNVTKQVASSSAGSK